MKKFLTVLLALSVVFTYSFSAVGTAFAATTTDANTAKALSYVTSIHDSAKKLVSDNGDQTYGTWEVSAANWALAYEDAYEALVNAVASKTGTSAVDVLQQAGVTGVAKLTDAQEREIKIAIEDYLAAKSTGKTYDAAFAAAALRAQLVEEASAAHKKVNSIDTSIYSTKEYTQDTAKHTTSGVDYYWNEYSYVAGTTLSAGDALYKASAVAESIIEGVNDGIDKLTAVDSTKTGSQATTDAVNAYTNLNQLMNAHVALVGDTNGNQIEDADETWTYTFVPTIRILTTAEEAADAASGEASTAAKKATIASNIAAFKADAAYLNASADAKAAYDEYLDAYNKAETYLVENVPGRAVVPTLAVSNTTGQAALVAIVKNADKYIEKAADMKADTNKDGSKKYDADIVDDNLNAILLDLYQNGTTTKTLTNPDPTITYVTNVEKTNEKAAVAKLVDADAMEYNNTPYYALEWKAVEAAVDAYNTAVDAAVVSSDITDAKAALNKAINKIDPASKVLTDYTTTGKALNTAAGTEFTKLSAYAKSLAADQGTADPLVFAITDITDNAMATSGADGTLIKYYIDKDARTAAEIAALNAEVKALLGSAKTASALKAEAQNVVNMINALPAKANITAADKDAIEAAYNAYEDLNPAYKVYVTNYSTLQDAISAVQKAEKDVFLAETKNLPPLSKVTVADKEAVQAIADKIDAYNNTEMYNNPNYSNSSVDALLNKIRTLEFDAVKAAAKDVPAADKVTADDKEKIEAVRAAYDELLANYGDDLTAAEVTTLAGYEKKIVEAEKALKAELDKKNAQEKIAIQGTHMKIYSSAKKGYIKISWKKSNGEVALDGVEVYRSTKKASGFKKISTFKKQTAKKYTKNMKKGTKYYFYVKGYKMVGDEKVYTHNSIKVARTFRK